MDLWVLNGKLEAFKQLWIDRLEITEHEKISARESGPVEILSPSLFVSDETPLVRIIYDYTSWSQKQRREFASLLKTDLAPGLKIVIWIGTLAKQDPLRKVISSDQIVEFQQEGTWIKRYVTEKQGEISASASKLLIEKIGEKESLLRIEIDKLLLSSLDNRIEDSQIQSLIVSENQPAIWSWVDAMMDRDEKSLKVLSSLENTTISPRGLIGALQNRLLLISWIKLDSSASVCSVNPYAWKQAVRFKKNWTSSQLTRAWQLLAEMESNLQTSLASDWTVLMAFILAWNQL